MSDAKTAVAKRDENAVESEALTLERKPATVATADEARTTAVADLLTGAYAQASTLKLTEAESKSLRAPFGDDKVRGGAKGDEKLLYISHIYVSDRLNDVLGIGQWALVKRSQRVEQAKTKDGLPLTRIYFEGVMLIRGAFVAEAVGVGQYHPNNPKEDYGSALESAMSDCMTRCCKRLGIGSQVWDKGYCDEWLRTDGGTRRPVGMPQEKQSPATAAAAAGDAPSLPEQVRIAWLETNQPEGALLTILRQDGMLDEFGGFEKLTPEYCKVILKTISAYVGRAKMLPKSRQA